MLPEQRTQATNNDEVDPRAPPGSCGGPRRPLRSPRRATPSTARFPSFGAAARRWRPAPASSHRLRTALNTGCDLGLRGATTGRILRRLHGSLPSRRRRRGVLDRLRRLRHRDGRTNRARRGNPPNSAEIGFRKRYCNSTLRATLPRHAWTLNIDAVEGSDEDSYRFNRGARPAARPSSRVRRRDTSTGIKAWRRERLLQHVHRRQGRPRLGGAAADAGGAAAEVGWREPTSRWRGACATTTAAATRASARRTSRSPKPASRRRR